MVQAALERIKAGEDIAVDTDNIFAQALAEQIANVIRERGARAHMTRRSPTVWTGYEEDPELVIAKYIRGLAASGAKRNMVVKMLKALTGTELSREQFEEILKHEGGYEDYVYQAKNAGNVPVDKEVFKAANQPGKYKENQADIETLKGLIKGAEGEELKKLKEQLAEKKRWVSVEYGKFVRTMMIDQRAQPHAFRWAKTYIEENTRNQEAVDRVVGVFRGLAVAKYLAFRVFAAPVVNLTALPTSTIATMKGAGIPYAKTWGLLGSAIGRYGKWRANKLDKKQAEVFDYIHSQGWDNAQFNTEALSTLQGAVGRTWNNIIEWGMFTFAESERLNRAATIAATYEGLRQLRPNEDFEVLMREAKEASDKAHGVYNRGNLPYLALGRHPAAHVIRSFYVFRTFSHTYIQNLIRLGFTEKDAVACSHMILAPALIAGAGASVLTPLISNLLKAFGWDEPEEEAYRKVGEMFGVTAEEVARYGLTGQIPFGLGFSTKGSLAIGIGDLPKNLNELLGAPGSVVEDFLRGAKYLARGDVFKGVEKILPTGMGNIFRAIREYDQGLTTTTNAPLFYGTEQVRPSLVESFLRGLSLNPVRIAGIRERQWKEYKVQDKYREWSRDIYAKIKRYLLKKKKDPEEWAEILGEIYSYNERAPRWGISPITGRSIATSLNRSFKPSKKEKMRKIQ